jgi:hypothetical protein
MNRLSATLCGSVLALPLLAAAAQAAPVAVPDSVTITENWAPSGPGWVAQADGSGDRVYPTGYKGNPNDNYLFVSNEKSATVNVPTETSKLPPADVTPARLWTVSSAAKANANMISTNYTLSMVVTDNVSNATKTATFYGKLTGTFYHGYSSFTNTFLSGPNGSPLPSVSQNVVLNVGNNQTETVTVKLDQFTSPNSNQASTNTGSIGAHLSANLGTGGGGGPGPGPVANGTPEPSTVVLSYLGLSGLGMASWRRWRAGKAARG